MDLRFLGAAGTVTGSKYLLTHRGHRVLVDCGLFQGFKQLRLRNWQPLPFAVHELEAVLLTHAHLDHSGYLPLLVRNGFRGRIYCTQATYELCRILLADSGRLQEEEAEYANRHSYSKHSPALPLYTEKDAMRALDYFEPRELHEVFTPAPGLQAELLLAGHILGSAMVRLRWDGHSALFTGDLGRPQDTIMRAPEAVAEAEWVVVESTYGNRRHDPADPMAELGAVIRRTTARGGAVIIPSFAVGRTQSLLYAIQQLKADGQIAHDLPVYLNSPMAVDVTAVYRRHHDEHRLDAEQCRAMCTAAHIVNTVEESRRLNERKGPMVIIAGSGMATGGRVVHHLKAFAPDARNTILFVGFQAGGTRGAALLGGAKSIKVHGEYVAVRAEVATISNLSAHADYSETLDWLAQMQRPPRQIFVTHGEPEAADALRSHISERFGWTVSVPEYLESVTLDGEPWAERAPAQRPVHRLRIRRAGIDTYQEPVIYLRADSHVCRSEGFEALSRVKLTLGERSLIGTLNIVRSELLPESHLGLSEAAWQTLGGREDDEVQISHPDPNESFAAVRGKVYGKPMSAPEIQAVIGDVAAGRYSALELAAFVTVCGGDALSLEETISLTQAMVDVGERLQWPHAPIVDKHCVGGLPGNRTTPIVVAIIAACGLTIPKSSSRAITSPAGTADTMETLAPVALDLPAMRKVVEQEGGCIVWGGAMALSPADDVLIRVERPLDFDSQGQLAASVLSKKIAAGSTHLLIDMPVGPTAKVRTPEAARQLAQRLSEVGKALGLRVQITQTDGLQPVGYGIGPALEARDVLAVLQGAAEAPQDLRERALRLAGELLELAGQCAAGNGYGLARQTLDNGAAWKKFQAICVAQGGLREPPVAAYKREFFATDSGIVAAFDNRRLARIAKLAGAPKSPAAGVQLHAHIGDAVHKGQALFTLHAESPGELLYAGDYAEAHAEVITVQPR